MAKGEKHSFIIQGLGIIRDALWNYPYFLGNVLKRLHRVKNIIIVVFFAIFLFFSYTLIYSQLKQGAYTQHTLILGIIDDSTSYNPLSDSLLSHVLNKLVFNQLLNINNQGVPIGDIASHWILNNSNTYISFDLNPKATWQNNDRVTSDDIVYSFNIQKKLNTNSPLSKMTIKKTGEYTFDIDLSPINSNYLETLLWPIFPKTESNSNLEVVGSGPYMLERSEKNDYELEANKNYFQGAPHIQKIQIQTFRSQKELFAAYEAGTINAYTLTNPEDYIRQTVVASQKDALYENPIISNYYALFFNLNQYKDQNIRKGISYAINKSDIQTALHGFGNLINTPINPASWAYTNDPSIPTYQYNPQKAIQSFNQSGYNMQGNTLVSKDGIPLSVTIAYEQNSTQLDILNSITHNLEAAGITVHLLSYSPADWSQKIYTQKIFDLAFVPIEGSIDPNPISLWDSVGVNNISSYTNSSVDRYLDLAKNTTDQSQRQKAYDLFQKAVMDDDPAVFLYSETSFLEARSNIKGIVIPSDITSESDLLNKVNNWYF